MTPEEARDAMLTVFKDAWDTTGYAAVWSDIPGSKPPVAEEPWARVTVRHGDGKQNSLANSSGGRIYGHMGTLWVQLMCPIGDGGTRGLQLARLVLQAFRDARGEPWYRNHRFRESGNDGAFSVTTCLIDFTYDDT